MVILSNCHLSAFTSRLVDPLSAVVIIDKNLFDSHPSLSDWIVVGLQQQFDADKIVKSTSKYLDIPNSIQWITPQIDDNGDKVPQQRVLFCPIYFQVQMVKREGSIDICGLSKS